MKAFKLVTLSFVAAMFLTFDASGPAPVWAQVTAPKGQGPTPKDLKPAARAAFKPKSIATSELRITGLRFQPKSVNTSELTMTGWRFQPKKITAGELIMTGLRFQPKKITTGELTMTGLGESEEPTLKATPAMEGVERTPPGKIKPLTK